MTFTFVLAESALELVPKEMHNEAAIIRESKQMQTPAAHLILDSSRHQAAMKKRLSDWEKRGRPDIVHFCALLALDSRLNQEQGVRFLVHTRNNEVIEFAPDVRLPRAYYRFYGLMQALFDQKEIKFGGEKVLITMRKQKLSDLLAELSKTNALYALDVSGKKAGISEIAKEIKGKDAAFVIGGFPHGAFAEKQVLKLPAFSISDKELCAWAVMLDVIAACELAGEGKK